MKAVFTFVWICMALACAGVQAQGTGPTRHPPVQNPSPGCGDFNYGASALGPLDFRITPPEVIDFVEVRHFPEHVERLIRGEKGTVAGDIAYTLGVFPNHPRALRSAAELTRRNSGVMPKDMRYTLNCWFDRAIAYRPDDPQVRVLWALELIRGGQIDEARKQTRVAEELAQANPTIHYNVGLLYFELKDYDRAMANAREAYGQGFDLPGLKNKLTQVGQWRP